MSNEDALREALAEMWPALQEAVRDRVAAIERALDELAAGRMDPATADHARGEAHKLSGLLGTVGRPRGSELAHALERALSAPVPADEPGLRARVVELRAIIEAD